MEKLFLLIFTYPNDLLLNLKRCEYVSHDKYGDEVKEWDKRSCFLEM